MMADSMADRMVDRTVGRWGVVMVVVSVDNWAGN